MKYLLKLTCDHGHQTPMTLPAEHFTEEYVEGLCDIMASVVESAGGCMWKTGDEDPCGADVMVEYETVTDEEQSEDKSATTVIPGEDEG